MLIKKPKIPPAFLESLKRPFADAEIRSRIPSQVEVLRNKLAFHYQTSDIRANLEQHHDQGHHYWEQSGQVMKWIGESVAKSKEYTNRKSARSKAEFHRQLVASKINRLLNNEPLAYILGTQPFGPLEIQCKEPVLIPRPETEHLFEYLCQLIVENSSKHHQDNLPPIKILDLCTGTGCIALLLEYRLNKANIKAEITAIDKNQDAISLAFTNKMNCLNSRFKEKKVDSFNTGKSYHLKSREKYDQGHINIIYKKWNSCVRVVIQQVDIFDDGAMDRLIHQSGPFDIITSNPPYITKEEWTTLDKNVRDWEDKEALIGDVDGESDGLAFYKRIAHLIKQKGLLALQPALSKMPSLLVEVGHNQAKAVQNIFIDTGYFRKIDLIEDPWQKERGVIAWQATAPASKTIPQHNKL